MADKNANQTKIASDTEFEAAVVDYIKCAHAALDQAQQLVAENEARMAKMAALIPQVVEALVKHQRMYPEDVKTAEAKLKDPVAALEILLKAADVSNTIAAPRLGQAVREKQGSAGPFGAPASNDRHAESNRFWMEQLAPGG